jgi:hypothetical protein
LRNLQDSEEKEENKILCTKLNDKIPTEYDCVAKIDEDKDFDMIKHFSRYPRKK